MTAKRLLLCAAAASLAGCATFLRVSESDTAALPDSPNGIVVNQRAIYVVGITPQSTSVTPLAPKGPLVGVDQQKVMNVGVWRMPFASGELGLKLTKMQTVEEVTLSSQPGSTKAAEAAKAALEADTDVRKALAPTATPIPATPTP